MSFLKFLVRLVAFFGAPQGRQKKMNWSARLVLEGLENRVLPAGGILPPPVLPMVAQVGNLPTARVNILPGAQEVVLQKFSAITLGRNPVRLTDVLMIPAFGSESLNQNTTYLTLRADLNGDTRDGDLNDGYESIISSAQADYTDLVKFPLFRNAWLTAGHPIKMEATASFSLNLSPGSIGVQVAEVDFHDLRNNPIPDSSISYGRLDSVLHRMQDHVIQLYQIPMALPASTVAPGTKDVTLLQMGIFSNVSVAGPVSFIATQGSLGNAENFRLIHTNYAGVQDASISGTVVNGKLSFNLNLLPFQSGNWRVVADIKPANRLPAKPSLQLALTAASSFIDLATKKPMNGVFLNGFGFGQVQFWTHIDDATAYTIA